MKPLIIAHRGDTKYFPQNTIEAFKSAVNKGADGFELDTHLDQNGNVIVVHDYTYDKTKNYLLLAEVLEKFGQKCRIEIEIKSLDPRSVKKIGDLIRQYNPKDFEITSSVIPLFPYIKGEFGDNQIGLIFKAQLVEKWMPKVFIEDLLISHLKLTGANVLHLNIQNYTKSLVENLHKNKFIAHTLLADSNLEDYKKIVDLGIDQLSINDIDLLKKI